MNEQDFLRRLDKAFADISDENATFRVDLDDKEEDGFLLLLVEVGGTVYKCHANYRLPLTISEISPEDFALQAANIATEGILRQITSADNNP